MKNKIKDFIMSTTPIKKPVMLITFASLMLALRLGLEQLSFQIGSTVVEFDKFAIYLAGFFLGPIFGFGFGWIADSLSFLMQPRAAVWMWQYSTQEPLIALFAGLLYLAYRKIKNEKTFLITFIALIVVLTIFLITMLSIFISHPSMGKLESSDHRLTTKAMQIIAYVAITLYSVASIIIAIYRYLTNKSIKLYAIVTILVIVPQIVFGLILGPIYVKAWFEKLNIPVARDWYISFLSTRLVKESILIPILVGISSPLFKALIEYAKRSQSFDMEYAKKSQSLDGLQ